MGRRALICFRWHAGRDTLEVCRGLIPRKAGAGTALKTVAAASDAGSGKTGPGKREASKSEQSAFLRDPDVQLMMRTKAGDDDAFSQLVAGYQDRLLSIFYHMLRDQGRAEDLVQEVFLRIYRARNGYQPTAKFSTWLFRIANNVASNARRTIGRRKEVSLNTQQESGRSLSDCGRRSMSDRSSLLPTRQAVKRETCRDRPVGRRHAQRAATHGRAAAQVRGDELRRHRRGDGPVDRGGQVAPGAGPRESARPVGTTSETVVVPQRTRDRTKAGNMEKIPRLSSDQRSNLVAYLDGELPEPAAKEIEHVLAKSPDGAARRRNAVAHVGPARPIAASGRQQRSDEPHDLRRQSGRSAQALLARVVAPSGFPRSRSGGGRSSPLGRRAWRWPPSPVLP